jgi:hypothetical protein
LRTLHPITVCTDPCAERIQVAREAPGLDPRTLFDVESVNRPVDAASARQGQQRIPGECAFSVENAPFAETALFTEVAPVAKVALVAETAKLTETARFVKDAKPGENTMLTETARLTEDARITEAAILSETAPLT